VTSSCPGTAWPADSPAYVWSFTRLAHGAQHKASFRRLLSRHVTPSLRHVTPRLVPAIPETRAGEYRTGRWLRAWLPSRLPSPAASRATSRTGGLAAAPCPTAGNLVSALSAHRGCSRRACPSDAEAPKLSTPSYIASRRTCRSSVAWTTCPNHPCLEPRACHLNSWCVRTFIGQFDRSTKCPSYLNLPRD